MNNKKAQVGETVTWIGATITITIIIVFFIGISILMAGQKEILEKPEAEKAVIRSFEDIFASTSSSAYLLSKWQDKTVYQLLQEAALDASQLSDKELEFQPLLLIYDRVFVSLVNEQSQITLDRTIFSKEIISGEQITYQHSFQFSPGENALWHKVFLSTQKELAIAFAFEEE